MSNSQNHTRRWFDEFFLLQRNQFRFLLGFSNFLFIVQTGFDPVLNLKRFFLFIGGGDNKINAHFFNLFNQYTLILVMHCLGLFKFKFNFHKFIRHFHNHNRSQKGLIKLVEHKLFGYTGFTNIRPSVDKSYVVR
jgi:hypothetical protein